MRFYALVKDIYLHPRSARRGLCWRLKEFLYSLHSTLHREWWEKEKIFLDTVDCLFLMQTGRVQKGGSTSVSPKSCINETPSLLPLVNGFNGIIAWFIETIINRQSIDFTPILWGISTKIEISLPWSNVIPDKSLQRSSPVSCQRKISPTNHFARPSCLKGILLPNHSTLMPQCQFTLVSSLEQNKQPPSGRKTSPTYPYASPLHSSNILPPCCFTWEKKKSIPAYYIFLD